MELLASLGAAAEPIAVSTVSKGTSPGASEAGRRAGAAESSRTQVGAKFGGAHPCGANRGMLEAEAAAVATLAQITAGAAPGSSRKWGERPPNEFLMQRAVDTSDVSAAEATAVAALSQSGRDSARKRARQLDFGRNSPGSAAVFAQAYPIKGQPDHDDEDDEQLSPSSAAGTLLGFVGAAAQAQWYGDGGGPSTPSKRKACNCKNSKCLKLYCECFASGSYCSVSCNCQGCQNNEQFQSQRKSAIDATLERNPLAFRPKIAATPVHAVEQSPSANGRHTKGCHCKKSGCLKKYCECFQAGVLCAAQCKCHDCKNTEESIERRTLLTSGLDYAATPQDHSSKDRLATPSPVHTKRSRQQQSPHGARGFSSHKQDGGWASSCEPATDGPRANLMLPRGSGPGLGPAIALQIQETMVHMRLAHDSSSAGSHISSVLGLPQEREAKLAERTAVRNHLSDPMLFNLCRVLLLGAKKVTDAVGNDDSERSAAKPPLAQPPTTSARKKHKSAQSDADVNTRGAQQSTSENGASRPTHEVDDASHVKDASPQQCMQSAVLLELRDYLVQMQGIIQARPSSSGSALPPISNGSSSGTNVSAVEHQAHANNEPPPSSVL